MSTEPLSDDEFLFVDDNGAVIDPCEEASFCMAMSTGTDTEVVGASSGEWYVVAAAEAAEYSQRTREFLREHATGTATEAGKAEAHQSLITHPIVKTPEASEGEEVVVDEAFETEAEWAREASTPATSAEWTPEVVVGSRTRHGVKSYKVKWRGYAEATWETYEWLFDEGYGPLVAAYHQRNETTQKAAVARVPELPKWRQLPCYTPEWYYRGRHAQVIGEAFFNSRLTAKRIAPCYGAHKMAQFLRVVDGGHVPAMVFQGTRYANVRSIIEHGLAAPGTRGTRVIDGRVYAAGMLAPRCVNDPGAGIYTARFPSVAKICALHFPSAGECELMLVCLGLIGPEYRTVANSDVCLFRNAEVVIPAWLVEYTGVSLRRSVPEECALADILGSAPPSSDAPPPLLNPQDAQDTLLAMQTDAARPRIDGGRLVPRQFRALSKRELRQALRYVKEAYTDGKLHSKHN